MAQLEQRLGDICVRQPGICGRQKPALRTAGGLQYEQSPSISFE